MFLCDELLIKKMKKKKIILIGFLILLVLILPGAIYYKIQIYKLTYSHSILKFNDEDYISPNQKKIDIYKYKLSFDLYPEKKMFIANAILTGQVLEEDIKSIDLNFYDNFKIKKIQLNDVSTDYVNEETTLSIPYNQMMGKEFKIEIEYEGTPKKVGLEGFAF